MSTPNVKVIGSINLGSVHRIHADYKLEVSLNEQSWILYRRYSAFENLHRSLITTYGEEKVKQLNLEFPEKLYTGSIAGSMKFIVDKRITQLQQYIDKLLSIDGTSSISAVMVFFDIQNKGLSGLQVQLGGNKVLKETFAHTKLIKNYVGAWGTSFIALLSSGSIVVLGSMYVRQHLQRRGEYFHRPWQCNSGSQGQPQPNHYHRPAQ